MVLEVRNVVKSLRRKKILRGVSLGLDRGALVGLVGENGAGKSTLVKIIVGLMNPDRGDVSLAGSFGYCPQEPLVLDRLTVGENFEYFFAAYGLSSDRELCHARMESLMDQFHFARYRNHAVSDLSGGTRQKLNLSLSLLHDPDILLLDEPYSGFDWETYLTFWRNSESLVAQGKSILLVTHFLHNKEGFDRIYTLREGILT